VLKRALGRTSDAGYRVYVGGDISHFYLSEEGTVREPSETGSHYDASEDEPLLAARLETLVALEDLGIAVDSTLHESAAGQYAVNLQYSDALFMADALMTYRFAVKHIAREHGMRASFMPRPFGDKPGCGLHLTLSLDEAGKNAFFDPEDAAGLSATARSFVAGLITHCNEIALATNPWVNSYKRLGVATDAPSAATWAWGVEDSGERLDLVRIPMLQTGHGASTRIEYRAADAACNPYLAIVAIIEAGLSGVNTQSPPPPRRERGDVAAECGNALPHTLWDAAEYAAQSELLNATLGPELTAVLVTRARDEWREHHAHISDWELKRYLLTL